MKNIFQNFIEYEIVRKSMITYDTAYLELAGRISFKPGQFVMARLNHLGDVALAICGDPSDKKRFGICVKANGSTTDQMINLVPGNKIQIKGPFGNFWPFENFIKTHFIIIAGGIGLASLRPLLLKFERTKPLLTKVTIVAGFRSDEQILFSDDLSRWKKRFNLHLSVEHHSGNHEAKIGILCDRLNDIQFNPKGTIALMCGPESMYRHCVDILERRELPGKQIFISMERNMQCGIGLCQHCTCGDNLVCQDGPIFRYDKVKNELIQ